MKNDQQFEETLQKEVADGFKYLREGRILELSALQLAQSSLVAECFLTGHPITPDIRGRTLRSILRWAVDRLKPGGEHNWFSADWRNFNTLDGFYIKGLKVGELAEKMGIAHQTLYLSRAEAITELVKVLVEEIRSPVDGQRRRSYVLEDQYMLHADFPRKVLRLLTAFGQSMPQPLIYQTLVGQADDQNLTQALAELTNSGMVISDPTFSTVLAHPETIEFLTLQLNYEERSIWHETFANYFLEKKQFIEAAKQHLSSGSPQKSVDVLLQHADVISNDMQIEELQQLISQFEKNDLTEESWINIQLLSGDNLKLLGNLTGAIDAYQNGLSAPSVELKAQAYYKRAMALFLINLDEALAHYDYCIQLLTNSEVDQKLLTRAYIGRAQLYMHENRLSEAEESLELASNLREEDREIFSYLQSAWHYLSAKQNDLRKAIYFGQQAWLAATELNDSIRMAEMSHNLGVAYAQTGEIDKSRDYLTKSTLLAEQISNLEMVALNHKTMGGLHFVQRDFDKAIEKYLLAWNMLTEMGNLNWQGHTAYDLAEAYGETENVDQFWIFFNRGVELAEQMGYSSLIKEFEALKSRFGYANLFDSLNERQQQIITYLQQHEKITNREYHTLAEISPRQALRDLQELLSKNLVEKRGKGRSVYYCLPTNSPNVAELEPPAAPI